MAMRNRKETAWKKSRKFGDVYGGRVRPRLVDNVFNRCHSLDPPGPHDELPICIVDNPSRDFMFPITVDEAVERLKQLPSEHATCITHLWLRRLRKKDYEAGDHPFACFIWGSGVRLIVLYPWPADLTLRYVGARKPTAKQLRAFEPWCTDLVKREGQWCLNWTLEGLRGYYLDHLLLHEVGHHVDSLRRRYSHASAKQAENFSDSYAVLWSQRLRGQRYDAT